MIASPSAAIIAKAQFILIEAATAALTNQPNEAFERMAAAARLLLMAELAASTELDGPVPHSGVIGEWAELQIQLATNVADNQLFWRGQLAVSGALVALNTAHTALLKVPANQLSVLKLQSAEIHYIHPEGNQYHASSNE
jgi:hypothetical protein